MMKRLTLAALGAVVALAVSPAAVSPAQAQQAAEIQLTYTNGAFQPNEVNAPADKPFTIKVRNADAKAMEFESKTLKVEKVIAAGGEAVVNVRAQKPGRYEFFNEFNEKARGNVVVK
jgi:heme/copper-type cytochrome/quinol oxidase subunit 2